MNRNEPRKTEMNFFTVSNFDNSCKNSWVSDILGCFFLLCYKIKKIDCLAFGILTILAGGGMRNVFYGGGGMQDFFNGGMREGGFFYGRREGGTFTLI